MLKKLIELDKWLFGIVNGQTANNWFDTIMPFIRQPFTWFPLYLFWIVFAIVNFPKKAFAWILGLSITVSITDLISSRLIKPSVGRLRPCNDPTLVDTIRLISDHCGQNGSFTSSHAANHFGLAMFIFISMQKIWGKYAAVFFIWAALICYAQVYIGVHFPFDVIGGGILGCLIGWMTSTLFHKACGNITLQ